MSLLLIIQHLLVCLCLSLPDSLSFSLHLLQSPTNIPPPTFLFRRQHSSSQALMRGLSWNVTGIKGFCLLHPTGSVLPALCAWAPSSPNRYGVAFLSAPLCPIEFPSGEITFLHVYRWVKRETGDGERWSEGRNEEKRGVGMKKGKLRGCMREEMAKFVFYILVKR